MVILHIAKLSGDRTNGVCVVVPQHVIAQQKYAQVKLVNLKNSYKEDYILEFKGFENFPEYLEEPFNHPDVVIIHEVNNVENITLGKILKKKNIPYIVIPHSEITKAALSRKWLKKKIAYMFFFNKFLKNAKKIQFLTKGEQDSSIFAKKGFVSANGIFEYKKKRSVITHAKGLNLLYIGRINVFAKGLDTLVLAVSLIQNYCRENEIKIDLYGKRYGHRNFIENNTMLESLINEKGVSDIITVHDAVFGEEKMRIIENTDYFIQTSRLEGMPMGVLEVLSMGVPCILTKETNMGEEVEEFKAGYCIYDGHSNPENIAKAIKTAFEQKDNVENMSENARSLAKKYNWDAVAKQAIEMYFKE